MTRPPPCAPDLRASIAAVLDAYGCTWDQVTSSARPWRYIPCRRAIYWLLHCRGWSLLRIGRFCSRDHTTILYNLKETNAWTPDAHLMRERRRMAHIRTLQRQRNISKTCGDQNEIGIA